MMFACVKRAPLKIKRHAIRKRTVAGRGLPVKV